MTPRYRLSALLLALLLIAGCATSSPPAQPPAGAPPAEPAVTATVTEAPELVERYQATITPDDLESHLYLFASDYFEGREATTPGQKLAAHYLASVYRRLGLEPKGTMATANPLEAYFQPFTVYGTRLQEARLDVYRGEEQVAAERFGVQNSTGKAYLGFGSAPEAAGGVVFGGYGIDASDLGYSDYEAFQTAGIDLAGKWLLILRDEPLESAEASLLSTEEGAPSAWTTSPWQKLRSAYGAGVRGILIVGDVGPRVEGAIEERVEQAAVAQQGVGSLSLQSQEDGRTYPPVYTISAELANTILEPSGRVVAELQQAIDAALVPEVFEVEDTHVESTIERVTYEAGTENVLAFIEGSDPQLRDEVVVLSSHYDHVGIDPLEEGDQIHNGADDDGSGTVSILEMAEAFMQARRDGYGPRRSILFLNVSAEEKGLLGSEYYADIEPVLPLEQTVTNLNIDMIGRHDPTREGDSSYVYIIGSAIISEDLDQINHTVNQVTDLGLELDNRFNTREDPNRFYRRSDHWNFGKHGIPFTFYFTGTHECYHQPCDEPDAIDYDRMARIARLIFGVAWQVANQDVPPAVSGEGFN